MWGQGIITFYKQSCDECDTLREHVTNSHMFPNAIYPIWFVPDKKPVAGEKN